MSAFINFTTPREAVADMVASGARFTVRRRADALALSFTYRVEAGGDIDRCRTILAAVKAKPAQFADGFRSEVQRIAEGAE